MSPSDYSEMMLKAHNDSEALRQFAERFRKKKSNDEESTAQFELDQESGQIHVSIFEAETGKKQLTLTPEEVAEGLKNLEETEDNASPLSSFFVDIKV